MPAYDRIAEIVERTRPDLVAIMTHPSARAEPVADAVAAGARVVLVEKPVALTPADLTAVERAAGDAFVVINTQYQWMPHWQRLLGRRSPTVGWARSARSAQVVGVDILEQGPHALSLAMAAARAVGLPTPTWVTRRSDGTYRLRRRRRSFRLHCTFDLGDVRLSLTAGNVLPRCRARPSGPSSSRPRSSAPPDGSG